MLVECRVPAYNRPDLLDRALRSLQAQDHREWAAVVLDDSREQSGRPVVEALGDARIRYHRNAERLGSTGNLNLAFSPQPMAGGECAFVLEDDNAITPDFIATAVLRIGECGLDVISLNQKSVVVEASNNAFVVQPRALRAEDADVVWPNERLILNALLKPSLPNGGYFWRCNTVDLRVDERIREPMLQESARQLRVGGAIFLAKEACSLWSALPPDLVRRDTVKNRVFLVTRDLLALAVVRQVSPTTLLGWGKLYLNKEQLRSLRFRLAGIAYARPVVWSLSAIKVTETAKGLIRSLAYKRSVPRDLKALFRNEPHRLFPDLLM